MTQSNAKMMMSSLMINDEAQNRKRYAIRLAVAQYRRGGQARYDERARSNFRLRYPQRREESEKRSEYANGRIQERSATMTQVPAFWLFSLLLHYESPAFKRPASYRII